MSIKIRKATPADFAVIHSLNREFAHFIKTPQKFMISVAQMHEEQEHFCILVAENQDEEIIGFATTFIAWYSWLGKTMYLDDLYIIEKYRGNGLGSRLLDGVIDMAKEQKCKKVKWQVSKWNKNAMEFYVSRGAEIDDVNINCDLML